MSNSDGKNSEIGGRIDQIRQYFCNGVNVDFAAKIGKDPTYASQICSGTKSTGKKILDLILETFPEVSRAWMFLGEGEMLKSDASSQHATVTDNSGIIVQHGGCGDTYNNNQADLLELIKSQQQTIQDLTEQNRLLTQIIASKLQ